MSWSKSILFSLFIVPLLAKPNGGEVVSGQATIINQDNQTLHIKTEQEKTIIQWKDFSIQKGEKAHFIQPNSSSATLNRVVGANPSEILGYLHSNGQLYLLNPNGVLIGEGAFIDTGAFIASTFNVLDSAFLKGENLEFFGDSLGSVINFGKIHTKDGDALLIGKTVENHGTITVNGGRAGAFGCTSLLYHPNSKDPLYVKGGISEELNTEGNAYSHAMKTSAKPDALATVKKDGEVYLTHVRNTGTITAKKGDKGGEVYVLGDHVIVHEESLIDVSGKSGGGTIYIGGSFQGKDKNLLASEYTFVAEKTCFDASALQEGDGGKILFWSDKETRFYGHAKATGGLSEGNGGYVEVSAPTTNWTYGGTVDLTAPHGKPGELLLDPNDITVGIAPSNPLYVGSPYIGAPAASAQLLYTDLAAALGAGNVTIQTSLGTPGGNGDIFFDLAGNILTWGSGNSLTVLADRDVVFRTLSDIQTTGGGTNITITAGRDYISASGSTIDAQGPGGTLTLTAGRNINALGGFQNSNISGVDATVNVLAQTGDITMGELNATFPINFGCVHGPVTVEATRGSINLTGGSIIGYYDSNPGNFNPTTGPITVLVGNDLTIQCGIANILSLSMIAKQGRTPHDVTDNPVTVNVGRNLFIQSGPVVDGPGGGIGRPLQLTGANPVHTGDITVNVGGDCTIFGGDNFSGIGDRARALAHGKIEARLNVNVGNNLMMGHGPGLPGVSGAFIGVFDNNLAASGTPENVRGTTHINVGNNFVMDARLGAAFVEFANDNQNGAFPAELFVHVGNSLLLIGGPFPIPVISSVLGANFNYYEIQNSTSHFWALNSIHCINGSFGSANLHNKVFNNTNVISPNLGTISARAGGDIRVAGGVPSRIRAQGDIVDYEASGGFTYIADATFANGELWGPQTALVGGVNIFAGTPLGSPSPAVFSNGQGAIAFDTNLYNTNAIPLSTQQIAALGYGSFATPPQTGVGNPITYWSQNGSPTIMSTKHLFANGTPANILNIGTTGPSISFNNESRAAVYTAPTNPFFKDGGDITIVAFRDTIISGPSTLNTLPVNSIIPIYAPSGNILVITQGNMTLRNNAVVSASENVDLVCDNQAPAPPQIGPGAFSIDATSFINSDNGYIRVYTARQAQNVIDPLAEFINGGLSYFFVPGQLFVDTDQEKWCTYYPDGDQGVPFKIFYKPCLETITHEAMIILTEFLYEESSFNYYLGWPENFYVKYTPRAPLQPGEWRSTFDSFNVSPQERYFIRRQDDTRANNNPRTYLTW
ncbi:MAG: filamentous hemagglutinin N-terminal domain-containing protein [Chlamydiales bacterium]|nr:filamentous hemagglutinin N-terminal domain-containing protein [Chlamydiales bacterium]